MDGHDDRAAIRGEGSQDLHNRVRCECVESRRGFVDKEDLRFSQDLNGERYPASLSPEMPLNDSLPTRVSAQPLRSILSSISAR